MQNKTYLICEKGIAAPFKKLLEGNSQCKVVECGNQSECVSLSRSLLVMGKGKVVILVKLCETTNIREIEGCCELVSSKENFAVFGVMGTDFAFYRLPFLFQ